MSKQLRNTFVVFLFSIASLVFATYIFVLDRNFATLLSPVKLLGAPCANLDFILPEQFYGSCTKIAYVNLPFKSSATKRGPKKAKSRRKMTKEKYSKHLTCLP